MCVLAANLYAEELWRHRAVTLQSCDTANLLHSRTVTLQSCDTTELWQGRAVTLKPVTLQSYGIAKPKVVTLQSSNTAKSWHYRCVILQCCDKAFSLVKFVTVVNFFMAKALLLLIQPKLIRTKEKFVRKTNK